jgi:hypothetical protein
VLAQPRVRRRRCPGRLELSLKGNDLRPGTTLELDVTATDDVGKVAIFNLRRGQQTLVEKCLPPGARSPSHFA